MITNLLVWALLGLIAGALGKWIMPGKDPGGIFITIFIGIAGALLGGFIASNLLGWNIESGLNLKSLAVATGGAILVLWLYRLLKKMKSS